MSEDTQLSIIIAKEIRAIRNHEGEDLDLGTHQKLTNIINVANRLNNQLTTTQKKLDAAIKMLEHIPCPSNCDNGAINPKQVGEHEWIAEQCQWCDELSKLKTAKQDR